MKIEQCRWHETGWHNHEPGQLGEEAHLVFIFGGTTVLKEGEVIAKIKDLYPKACLIGCSTAGEICCTEVYDNNVVVTAVALEKTRVKDAFAGH